MIVILPLSTNVVTNYDCNHIYDYCIIHNCQHRYTCMIHLLLSLYNYIAEYASHP
jgi:hypothetical protein